MMLFLPQDALAKDRHQHRSGESGLFHPPDSVRRKTCPELPWRTRTAV